MKYAMMKRVDNLRSLRWCYECYLEMLSFYRCFPHFCPMVFLEKCGPTLHLLNIYVETNRVRDMHEPTRG